MATNYNNVKCEGCIHLGDDGRCWQGVKHRPYCTQRMTLTDAVKIPPVDVTRAARDYADGVLKRTDPEFAAQGYTRHEKMRAAMFSGTDIEDAFEAGAAWAAQFAQHPDK